MIIQTLQIILLIAQIVLGMIGIYGKDTKTIPEENCNTLIYSSYGCCILILLLGLF